MRNFFLSLILIVIGSVAYSQSNDHIVKTGSKGLYLEHKVAAKESIYSIGREYSVHPKYLAAFNKLEITQGLNLGQLINIPLTDTNLNRKSGEGTPVYYQSSLKQTAGSVSALTKTPSSNIRKWNNLGDDNIPASTKIIIGYLVQGESSTVTAGNSTIQQPPVAAAVVEEKKEIVNTVPEKKEEVKEVVAVKTAVTKEEVKATEQIVQHAIQSTTSIEGEGYFKSFFAQQIKAYPLSKDETVTAGIFKTSSGWDDAKFYALIDGIEAGTIIRVTNPTNNKIVFVKVLGQMSGIRQNEGYNLRISNASAAALQLSETDKFILKVNY